MDRVLELTTMRGIRAGRVARGWILAAAVALGAPAFAFYPFGGSPIDGLDIRFITWSKDHYMDDNGDGDVSGPGEGIEMTLEGGEFGWTPEEMDIIKEAFGVWASVATSFAEFHFTDPIQDPAEISRGTDETALVIDGVNLVAVQVEDDPIAEPSFSDPGLLGLAQIDFLIEDTFLLSPDGTVLVPITGGQILECDIIISGPNHRPSGAGAQPLADLKSTMVHEIGHLLGLGHTPMNNVEIDEALGQVVETALFAQRGPDGKLGRVGITPTMFPFLFFTDDGTGELRDGSQDLAPDDIAGISFLYPRRDPDPFFSIFHFARSQARQGFPSFPILGGLVTAWCDADNDPATPRVPLVSTLTGLYTYVTEVADRGQFALHGLPKEIEAFGVSGPFQASYTLTIEPMNGIRFPGQPPDAFDSTHAATAALIGRAQDAWTIEYDTNFPSEVFHRDGGFFGRDNFDRGTALVYDQFREVVVAQDTGRSIDRMLPSFQPMFGDRSKVCPLNEITTAIGFPLGMPNKLRGLRDGVLLHTALGALIVDAYYHAGPAMARFLASTPGAMSAAKQAMIAVEFSFDHAASLAGLGAAAVIAFAAWRRRRRVAIAAASVAILTGLLVSPAHALVRYLDDGEKAELADIIIEGRVETVSAGLMRNGTTVQTSITFVVQEGLKGRLNKQSRVTLSLLGGRVGDRATFVTEFPTFTEGEEVILYLVKIEGGGYATVGGFQAKVSIFTDAKTGERFVPKNDFTRKASSPAGTALADAPKTVEKATPEEQAWTPLETFKEGIRAVVKAQRRNR